MHSDDEKDDDNIYRNDFEFKVEQIVDHSKSYLNHLLVLKKQLNDINQSDLYIEKLNEIGKIVHNLAENLRNIEQLYLQLDKNERLKLNQQIDLLRIEIDREMTEFYKFRGQIPIFTTSQENLPLEIDSINNNDYDQNLTTDTLRRRHLTIDHSNDSYDLLEQELAYLREKADEIATIVAQQQQTLSRTEYIKHLAQHPINNASSLIQKAFHNRYVTLASGALLGATISGPVGFVIGSKVGALVALTGSAVGALSVNIMQHRAAENDESQNNDMTPYNQAML